LSIAAGPDGALWFTESGANAIGRIVPPPTSKDQCKKGGYEQFGFKNHGRCIAFVNHPKAQDPADSMR
jgi:hypothetical protein